MSKVKLEVVDIPASTINVKSGRKFTKKILPGVSQTLAPAMDKFGRVITGTNEKDYTEIMAKDDTIAEPLSYKDFYRNLAVKVTDKGKDFDRSIPKHELTYRMLLTLPEVAMNKDEVNSSIHDFYLVDEETEAKEKLTTMDSKIKAFGYLNQMTPEDIKDILFLYGINTLTSSDSLAKAKIGEKIEEDAKTFISLFEDNGRSHRILLRKLLAKNIVRKEGGAYFYGEQGDNPILIGGTEELAVEFLKDVKNQDLYISLLKMVED